MLCLFGNCDFHTERKYHAAIEQPTYFSGSRSIFYFFGGTFALATNASTDITSASHDTSYFSWLAPLSVSLGTKCSTNKTQIKLSKLSHRDPETHLEPTTVQFQLVQKRRGKYLPLLSLLCRRGVYQKNLCSSFSWQHNGDKMIITGGWLYFYPLFRVSCQNFFGFFASRLCFFSHLFVMHPSNKGIYSLLFPKKLRCFYFLKSWDPFYGLSYLCCSFFPSSPSPDLPPGPCAFCLVTKLSGYD